MRKKLSLYVNSSHVHGMSYLFQVKSFMSCHAMSCRNYIIAGFSCHQVKISMLCHAMSSNIYIYVIAWFPGFPCVLEWSCLANFMPCHAMPCHAMPCLAILICLANFMPCHAMPCHVLQSSCHRRVYMLCYVFVTSSLPSGSTAIVMSSPTVEQTVRKAHLQGQDKGAFLGSDAAHALRWQ